MSKQAENSMSAATDKGVLAVMDAAVSSLGAVPGKNAGARKLREARATVAELIAFVDRVAKAGVSGTGSLRGDFSRSEAQELLARCGGAQ